VERGFRTFVVGRLLCVLDSAAVLQVGSDAGRPGMRQQVSSANQGPGHGI
jgi:hypothetical protein